MNCNQFNPNLTYELDPGMRDRIHLISTYRIAEIPLLSSSNLSEGSPNILPEYHIPWLAEKLNVSTRVLMLKFLRLCADKFLNNIGREEGVNKLEEKVRYHAGFLRMQIGFNDLACFVSLMICMMAFAGKNKDEYKRVKPIHSMEMERIPWGHCLSSLYSFYNSVHLQPAFCMLKKDYEECSNQDRAIHPYRALINLDPLTVKEVLVKKLPFEDSKDLLGSAVNCFRSVRTRQGQYLTDKVIYWVEAWNKIKYQASALSSRLTKEYYQCTNEDVRVIIIEPPNYNLPAKYTQPEQRFDTLEKVEKYIQGL